MAAAMALPAGGLAARRHAPRGSGRDVLAASANAWKQPARCMGMCAGRGGVRSRFHGIQAAVKAPNELVVSDEHEDLRSDLKDRLYKDLEKTSGNLSDTSLELIASLEKLNPTSQPALLAEKYQGDFIMLNSTTQGVLYKGAIITLGRATFNSFEPVKLSVRMEDVYNYVGGEGESHYNVEIHFTVAEEGKPPLEGKLLNKAAWERASSDRLNITFLSSALMPRNPEKELEQWLEVFKDVNTGMGNDGVLEKQLPAYTGWLDFVYLDEELRITRGNAGSIVIVKRL